MFKAHGSKKMSFLFSKRRLIHLLLIPLITALSSPALAENKLPQTLPVSTRAIVATPIPDDAPGSAAQNNPIRQISRFVASDKNFDPRESRTRNAARQTLDSSQFRKVIVRPESGTPRHIKFRTAPPPAARTLAAGGDEKTADLNLIKTFLEENKSLLRLENPDKELRLERYEKDGIGMRHVRFSQRYQDLPIWPAAISVHLNRTGAIDSIDGLYVATPKEMITNPVIEADTAIDRAKKAVPGGLESSVSATELIVHSRDGGSLRLAWKIKVTIGINAIWLVIIDALNGNTIEAFNTVMNAGTTGSGIDVFGQSKALDIFNDNGTYLLIDTSKDMYDPTSQPPNLKGAFIYLDAQNYPQTDNPQGFDTEHLKVISSSAADAGWVDDGVSLSYYTSLIYDYFQSIHGWQSHDGKGGTLRGIVRYGKNFANAFMNAENNLFVFGDGDLWPTLDVVAHEFQHGVTYNTANLVYRNQSGAMNEAFSDIFAEMIEFHVNQSNDWIFGTHLADVNAKRSMADPHSYVIAPLNNRPYPDTMSEYINVDFDNGGVHLNHTIISHAFYLLAVGLDGAIGREDATKIFFRALRYHLVQNSQFIDARLACISSAEEIWANNPNKRDAVVAKIKQAFDQVELHEAAPTPDPVSTTRPPVQGTDSSVFVYPAYDPYSNYFLGYYLGRCEDGECVELSNYPVRLSRPSVSGDGSLAVFVDAYYDFCYVPTDGSAWEECLGYSNTVYSVAMSPDQSKYAFVLLNSQTNEPENSITILEKQPDDSFASTTYELVAPVIDGTSVDSIIQADALDFSGDGRFLVYDALTVIEANDGYKMAVWSLYSLDLDTGQITTVVPPIAGLDIGYPALAKTSDHFLVFDAYDSATDQSTVIAMNTITGEYKEIATVPADYGVPGYTGDDALIFYSDQGDIWARPVADDRITPTGEATRELVNASFGVVYRRGGYTVPVPRIGVDPNTLAFGEVVVTGSVHQALTIRNTGTAELNITEIALAGNDADSFKFSPGGCAGQSLAPAGTCAVQVQFEPVSANGKNATLQIHSNAEGSPVTQVPLSGTGKAISRYTITVSQDGNGTINPNGIVALDAGSNQSFGFTPGSGHHIADVIVNGTSVGAVASHTVENISANITLHVVFAADEIPQRRITVTQEGAGDVVPSGTITVDVGSSKTFSFTPAQNFHLADVWVNGMSVGNPSTYLLSNITEDTTIHAIFEANLIGDINNDSALDLKDTIIALQILVGLRANNPGAHGDVDGDSRIGMAEALYSLRQQGASGQSAYTITASSGDNGSISPNGEVNVSPGGQQSFMMTPESGYRITDVKINGTSVGPVSTYAFNDVRANASIHVTFVQDQQPAVQHTITATAGANGSISPSDAVAVTENGSQKFTMTPAAGYNVLDVKVNGQSIGAQNSYTFVGVTEDATIHATFAQDQQVAQHTITVTADAHAVIDPNGSVLVGHGQSKRFTISAREGFFLKDVLVDGVSKGPLTQYTFTNVTADHTLSVQTADQPQTGTLEVEPNNSPEAAQSLGELSPGNKLTVSGKLTSGGISGDTYTGDLDFYRFKLTSVSNLPFFLDWTGSADVDLAVVVWDEILVSVNGAEKPIQTAGALSPEDFLIAIGSKTGAADYSFTLQCEAVNPYYPNNNAILNGKYTRATQTLLPNGGVIIFMNSYIFDGVSKWQNCSWTETSGEACYEYGNYKIWYPFIVLEHTESGSGGKIEVLPLDFDSETQIYIDNQSYPRE
jgi:Zn-dependent metalloprotease